MVFGLRHSAEVCGILSEKAFLVRSWMALSFKWIFQFRHQGFLSTPPGLFPRSGGNIDDWDGLCCTNRVMAEVPLSPDRLIPQLP